MVGAAVICRKVNGAISIVVHPIDTSACNSSKSVFPNVLRLLRRRRPYSPKSYLQVLFHFGKMYWKNICKADRIEYDTFEILKRFIVRYCQCAMYPRLLGILRDYAIKVRKFLNHIKILNIINYRKSRKGEEKWNIIL